jgi:hypothetical protein
VKVPSVRAPAEPRSAAGPPADSGTSSNFAPPPAGSPIGYLKQLWRAEIPLSRVFWQDMVLVGTFVNLAAMGVAFLAVALGASTAIGIAIHLAPVPYNILLVASVWQRAGVESSAWSSLAKVGAVAWLLIAFVV